jgi:hypothetical protein
MNNKSLVTAFILGFLISILFALAFFAGQQQGLQQSSTLQNNQVLLDGKIHLIEMKVDVISGQKDTAQLQSDFDRIMEVLEQSHQYTGEGIIARDQSMQAASAEINAAIVAGGIQLIEAIESLLAAIEYHLHTHEEILETEVDPSKVESDNL